MLILVITLLLPPCEYGDSANCHWIASERGNGAGQSFYDINGVLHPIN